MAQSNFEERIDTYEIESTNVMTGDRDRSRYLYYQLKMSMAKAKQIDIIVSFLMESGVRMLLNDMKRALDRGVKIRILTGNYLGITQPSALYLIKSELGDRVDLRLYNETSRSFHPKSYIFHYESSNEIYIGSSNISKSALTSGIEWNYRFSDTLDKKNYELFYATFEDLFLNHSIIIDDEELKRYSKAWKKPAVSRDLAKYDTAEDNEDRNAENVRMLYRPRGAQIEALYALQESRMEGAAKGLVYAATGIGKTYLAAFDSAKYERVLFVAHREEILKQAAVSFKNVRNSEDYGFFDGKEKDRDKSVIFASVAILGRPEYLNETYFPADYFDYVIIDAPPLGVVIDAVIIGKYTDGAVIVIEQGVIKRKIVQDVIKQLKRGEVRILGAVLNKVDERIGAYGNYEYKYSYSYYGESDTEKNHPNT